MAIIPVNIENLKPNKEYIVTVRSKNNDVNVFLMRCMYLVFVLIVCF